MIFKKISVVKKRRGFHKDFTKCFRAQNFVLSKECAHSFNFDGLPVLASDEYAKIPVDNSAIIIKKDGQVFGDNGVFFGIFNLENIFYTMVYISGKEYLYLSDGDKGTFVNPSVKSIVAPFNSTVATFHKGRLYFYENGIFKSSAPMSPEVVDDSLSVDFLPYDNYGKVFYAVDYFGYVYVVAEFGVFRFTEVSSRRIKVENVFKSSVKINEGTAVLIGRNLYFSTDDIVYKLTGNTLEKFDEPISKGYLLTGAICGGNSESYYIKNGLNQVVVYDNGSSVASYLFGVEVNRCGVFLSEEEKPCCTYEVDVDFYGNYFGLKGVKCRVEKDCEMVISTPSRSKRYTLHAGQNNLLVGLNGKEFKIKINSTCNEQIIYSLEYEYYLRSSYEGRNKHF